MNIPYPKTLRWLVGAMVLVGCWMSSFAACSAQSFMNMPTATVPGNDRAEKIALVLELANVAAEAELFELSMDAVRRVCQDTTPDVVPKIASSLLGGPNTNTLARISGRTIDVQPTPLSKFSKQIFSVVDVWRGKKAPVASMQKTLEAIVFPESRPSEVVLMVHGQPSDTNSYSYEFSFKNVDPVRVLGFELVDVARENNSLPALVERLEKLRQMPAAKVNASIMLAYAKRSLGQATQALESVAELCETATPPNVAVPLYCALTKKIDGGDVNSIVTSEQVRPWLIRTIKKDVWRMDLRAALMEQLSLAIAAGDQVALEEYLAAVSEALQVMPNSSQENIAYMLRNLHSSLIKESRAQKKPALVVAIGLRELENPIQSGIELRIDEEVLNIVLGAPDASRLKLLRKMLLGRKFFDMSRFGFVGHSVGERVPSFFIKDGVVDKARLKLPYEQSVSQSLLDLLLNQAEADGDSSKVISELLANSSENLDVQRLLVQWVKMRAEKAGKTVDPELMKSGEFATESEYMAWLNALPQPASMELAIHRIESGDNSGVLLAALETMFLNSEQTSQLARVRFQSRQLSDKSIVSANELKHWIVTTGSVPWTNEWKSNATWIINEKQQVESLGGAWYGQLLFRYPLPMRASIQSKTVWSDKKSAGLHCGGVEFNSQDAGDSITAFVAGLRRIGKISSKAPKDTSVLLTAKFDEGLVEFSRLDQSIAVRKYSPASVPYLGLANYGRYQSEFSEVQITAAGSMPREVSLLDESLTGWSAQNLSHALPKCEAEFEAGEGSVVSDEASLLSVREPKVPMWRNIENELRSGKSLDDESPAGQAAANSSGGDDIVDRQADAGEVARKQIFERQSFLNYLRPLCDGERVDFEFYHDPAVNNAAAVIGRTAYLLREGKVVLHWITSELDVSSDGISATNLAEDPAAEVLAPLKLEQDSWNRAAVKLEGGLVTLSINDVDVYRRATGTKEPQIFGFFCDPTADAVRVRKVVLRGDWPTEIPLDLWERK